jgi:hypothetical protein
MAKTASTYRSRPPTLREIGPGIAMHLRELAGRRDAWLVLMRNAVPVIGVFAFGWSGAIVVFSYWFDGLVALSAIMAAMVPRALRESDAAAHAKRGPVAKVGLGLFCWLILVGVVGLPYWIVLIPLAAYLTSPELWRELASSPSLWATFGGMVALHYWNAFRRGYDTLPDRELKQRARTDLYLLLLRAMAMFFVAGHFAFLLVPLMAVLLSYLEIWPERAIGMVWGDPTRLHEDHDGSPP